MWHQYSSAALVAAVTFGLALANGTYHLVDRHIVGIAIWWAVGLSAALALRPAGWNRAGLAGAGVFAAFVALTGASVWWSADAEAAFVEFNRNALYLGAVVVVLGLAPALRLTTWLNGFAAALVMVLLFALSSRLLPGWIETPEHYAQVVSLAGSRLSYPVGYWNGLAALGALALPLCLRIATASAALSSRASGLAPIPAIASALYLTSSRGGMVAASCGMLAFVLLTPRRVEAILAVAIAGLGAFAAIHVIVARPQLTAAAADVSIADGQGQSALVLIVMIMIGSAAVWVAVSKLLAHLQPSRGVERAMLLGTLGIALVAFVAARPADRFDTFRRTTPIVFDSENYVQQHLTSGSGNGRWQLWSAAVDQWREHPMLGDGAGSFQAWWNQHGDLEIFVRDAHSLYVEVLGELGLVGLLLLAVFLLGAFASGVLGLRRAEGDERIALAATTASFLAFAIAAGVDWLWEVTAIALVGVALAALLYSYGGSRQTSAIVSTAHARRRSRRHAAAARVAVGVAAAGLVIAQAIPLLVELRLRESRGALLRGDERDAIEHALAARRLQPWAATPHLQLALVAEGRDLGAARRAIEDALERSGEDWSLWLVASRIQTLQGDVERARSSLARARELNPRAFAQLGLGPG